MLRVDYKHPFEKLYQYEYAVFNIISGLFKEVSFTSNYIDIVRLYYIDLIKLNDSGNPSYKKQNELDRECLNMVNDDFLGSVGAGQLNQLRAYVTTPLQPDGTHAFVFECDNGASFAYRIRGRGHNRRIEVRNLSRAR